jgi:hypothetical protein
LYLALLQEQVAPVAPDLAAAVAVAVAAVN